MFLETQEQFEEQWEHWIGRLYVAPDASSEEGHSDFNHRPT